MTDVLSKELEEALEKDSVSFIEQVYTSKDNRKVRTKLEESQKLWMDFLAAGDAVDVYLKGKVRIDVGNLFSLEKSQHQQKFSRSIHLNKLDFFRSWWAITGIFID